MNEVPASAILLIVGIIVACLLGAFVFSTITSQRQQGSKALSQTEQMGVALDESKITIYDGQTVTGSQVLSAITILKDQPVVLCVDNGSGTNTPYIYTSQVAWSADDASMDSIGTKMTASQLSDAIIKAQNPTERTTYITPSAQFIGKVIRDKDTNAITALCFQPVNKTTASTP